MPGSDSLVFLHGLESGPHGSKYQALTAAFGPVLAPDTEGLLDPWERLATIEALTRSLRQAVIVGSSFGGLMAVLLAARHPMRCKALVLLAPALYGEEVDGITHGPPTRILHGRHDTIVPLALSERYATRTGAELIVCDDDHRLAANHDRMLIGVRQAISLRGSETEPQPPPGSDTAPWQTHKG